MSVIVHRIKSVIRTAKEWREQGHEESEKNHWKQTRNDTEDRSWNAVEPAQPRSVTLAFGISVHFDVRNDTTTEVSIVFSTINSSH